MTERVSGSPRTSFPGTLAIFDSSSPSTQADSDGSPPTPSPSDARRSTTYAQNDGGCRGTG